MTYSALPCMGQLLAVPAENHSDECCDVERLDMAKDAFDTKSEHAVQSTKQLQQITGVCERDWWH